MIWLRYILIALVLCVPGILSAQDSDDDKGYLTRLLQDSLGGEGRVVDITGFEGALSSEATIDKITVADKEGVWLTLTDLTLQWTRSALLRGEFDVQTLSAKTITLARAPKEQDDGLPAPEAAPFSLPELPVSINLDTLKVDQITIGAPILGEELRLSLKGSAALAGGDASVDITARRMDDKRGTFHIKASFVEATQMLGLDLALSEAEDGIAVKLLDLPGQPSVDLTIAGNGPLDEFTSDIALKTDGQERLTGKVTLGAVKARAGGDDPARRFSAELGGDVTPLFAPRYHRFFGDEVSLRVAGQREPDGALEVSELTLKAQELALSGAITLNADQWPTQIALEAELGGRGPVILPITGPQTKVSRAALNITYSADQSNEWTARFDISELARAGIGIGALQLSAGGVLEGDVGTLGRVTADVRFAAEELSLADPALAEAVGSSLVGTFRMDYTEDEPLVLSDLDLRSASAQLTGAAEVDTLKSGFETDLQAKLTTSDLSKFSKLVGQPLTGAAEVSLTGTTALGGQFDMAVSGTSTDLALGQPQVDPLLRGQTELDIVARRNTLGITLERAEIVNDQMTLSATGTFASEASEASYALRIAEFSQIDPRLPGPLTAHGKAVKDAVGWRVDLTAAGPLDARAKIAGLVTGPNARIRFDAGLPDIRPLVPAYSGAVALNGTLAQSPEGWLIDTDLSGPYGLTAEVDGRLTGENPNFRYDARLPDIRPIVPAYTGPLAMTGTLQQASEGWLIDTDLNGPYSLTADVAGRITGDGRNIRFDAKLPDVRPLVPAYSGPLAVTGTLVEASQGWLIDTDLRGPYGIVADVEGTVTGDAPAFRYTARLPDIRSFVPEIGGALTLDGTAQQAAGAWQIDTALTGPGGTNAKIAGTIASGDQMNLTARGSAPLGLSEPFLRPRSLQGQANFDLALNGAPTLGALSGTISTSGARFSAPKLLVALTGIDARADITNGRANLSLSANVSNGGRLSVSGPVQLSGAMPADLKVSLAEVVVTDALIYHTRISGSLGINGPLLGGARIAGRLSLGKTSISIPSTGITSFGSLPPITHVNTSAAVRDTQKRAGVGPGSGGDAGASGPGYPLDVTISAPSRIYVRGRGLDAELGGELRLTGTTSDIISAGRFDLIRGRLDVLEKRFDLDEGRVLLQGDFDPYLVFVARTETGEGTASVTIEGPASSPEVRFGAVPDAPQDEVLSQIFFRRDLTQLSPLQAAQLASAVATLAGKGGEGLVGTIRRKIGVDDLDITTDEEGNTGLRVGKYISEKVYTDVTTSSGGGGEVSLNIDLSPSVTASGSVDSENESKLGIFFQKDY
ncbi:translocation/assembly module TamB [Pseudohalocynthiibacter aestuariivivens]|nr:translocation/assembly module TamB domain-containing protein [Pseudohalocynthiibacter aestuariivivens]QIE46490.1 translocation/assembly module TamB [Pseudohalocynthiibacter aestuariivivens]